LRSDRSVGRSPSLDAGNVGVSRHVLLRGLKKIGISPPEDRWH
jgi:hypothetical protein